MKTENGNSMTEDCQCAFCRGVDAAECGIECKHCKKVIGYMIVDTNTEGIVDNLLDEHNLAHLYKKCNEHIELGKYSSDTKKAMK